MAAVVVTQIWAHHPTPTDWIILASLVPSAIACTFVGLAIHAFRVRLKEQRRREAWNMSREVSLPPGEDAVMDEEVEWPRER